MSDAVQVKPERPLRVKRPVPGWVSVAVLAGCLLGGAWLLWWFVAGSAPRERTVTLKEVPRQARRGGPSPVGSMFRQLTQAATGVLVVKGDEWHVRAPGSAVMRVLKRAAGGFDVNFYYDRNDLVTPEDLALLTFRAQVANNDIAARAASVTATQLAAFKKLQSQTGMLISPAERLEMTELWEQYAASSSAESKSAAEAAIVERLETIGKKNLDPTKQQMSTRAAFVKSLLTPEQLKRVQQPPRRR
ncbi:MAG: hypothetical protein M3478_07545 [Planctomycetota bacterium]|nr:hypothetical protein [Planctomycetota bacterium]